MTVDTRNPEVSSYVWDKQDPEEFLADDASNPVRLAALKEIEQAVSRIKKGVPTLLEIGCGPGIDYLNHIRPLVTSRRLKYIGFDICAPFIDRMKRLCPETGAAFKTCGFGSLPKKPMYDITYAKAVLEHQPALNPALRSLLQATKRTCIISWYLAPDEQGAFKWSENDKVHYNRFAKSEVYSTAESCGFSIVEKAVEQSTGLLYILTRK